MLASLALAPMVLAAPGKTMYQYIGWDAAFWPKGWPVKAENYRKFSWSGRGGGSLEALMSRCKTDIDTIVFSPVFSFGSIAGNLKSAEYVKHQPDPKSRFLAGMKNGMPELIAAGTDPIAETIKFCREYKKEVIVSMPLNFNQNHGRRPDPDHTHNSWHCYLYPTFKLKHPELLMNGGDESTSCPYGGGYLVDFSKDAVIEKFVANTTEILGKYDLDGMMIDFMMTSPVIFATVAKGGTAEAKEMAKLTAMMQKIQAAVKAASTRLGHPVTFSARVPDSVGYCKDIGIDLAAWLEAKMFDFVVFGGRFQLNPWKVTGELMAKYQIPYYADFGVTGIYVGNDSGYPGDDERLPRMFIDADCHRARIAEALEAGAAGCVYTQAGHHELGGIHFNSIAPFDAKQNRLGDKRYFVTYTNTRLAGSALKDGMKHATVDVLLSGSPEDLAKGIAKHKIYIHDDFAALKRDGIEPKLTLVTEVSIPSGMETIVTFNGKELKSFKKRSGTQLYELPLALAKHGANDVVVKSKGKNKRGETAKLGNIAVEVHFPKADKKEGGK